LSMFTNLFVLSGRVTLQQTVLASPDVFGVHVPVKTQATILAMLQGRVMKTRPRTLVCGGTINSPSAVRGLA
jgi:hypothetical protein